MRFISDNAAAINSATGPLLPADLPEQIRAYNRGAKDERTRIATMAREMAAEHAARRRACPHIDAPCDGCALSWAAADAARDALLALAGKLEE